MRLTGSINVWTRNDGSVEVYQVDADGDYEREHVGVRGRAACLIYELAAICVQDKHTPPAERDG